jgi:hypothetical protein
MCGCLIKRGITQGMQSMLIMKSFVKYQICMTCVDDTQHLKLIINEQ